MFMKRKLVRQGGSAMTITLPSDWVKRFKLEGGDEIDLEEQQGKLIISTEAGKKENSIELSVSGLGPWSNAYWVLCIKQDMMNFLFVLKHPKNLKLPSR